MRKPIVNQPVLGENESSGSGASNTIPALTTPAEKDSDDMADTESTSGKSPAFQFYPSDFVTGTITLTTEEIGAYILLLCHCWDRGSIPADLRLLARIARLSLGRMKLAWAVLVHKFIAIDGGYIQPRLERERQKQAEFRQRQSENGRRGGRPKNPPESQNKGLGFSGLTQTETQTEPKKSSSVFGLQSSSSDFGQEKTDARSKHPVFKGRRFVVFEWMLDDLSRMLGSHANAFDLHAWFYDLDEQADSAGVVVPQRDGGKWLQERTQAEAIRRGLPLASSPTHNPKTAGNLAAAARFVARGQK